MTTSHRVYACILRKSDGAADALDVLLSAERHQGTPLIKLPGGGKLPGESDEQCLVRELSEELQLVDVKVGAMIHQSTAPVKS
ncbi:MAG: NUDIX hydrolase, partial [Flavobacteriales bacterium]|nr:NUDIX hydrolase [Flavobacteriales bacterium]